VCVLVCFNLFLIYSVGVSCWIRCILSTRSSFRAYLFVHIECIRRTRYSCINIARFLYMKKTYLINTKSINIGQRLISLDVFRGITVAMMILVNSPGNSTPYAWLVHSRWNGCTLADVVFPFFIVILGISSVYALSNLKAMGVSSQRLLGKILKRSGYIFLMGLLLNAMPHFDLYSTLAI